MNDGSAAAVEFDDVSVSLGGVSILESITAHAPEGGCTAIVGPNGAGKTTLLHALLGEIPYQGRIRISNGGRQPSIGFVPQRLDFDRGMPIAVAELMVLGIQRRPVWLGLAKGAMSKARELLASVGASELERRHVGALSGGELQRVLLALALGRDPDLLILDEPASGVDLRGGQIFCELLDRLRSERGFTQLMVSHDLAMVTHHASHVICLNRKMVAQGPPRETLTTWNLTALFGLHMGLVDAAAMPSGSASCTATCCQERRND